MGKRLSRVLFFPLALEFLPYRAFAHASEQSAASDVSSNMLIIATLGVITLTLLTTTFILGRLMPKNRPKLFLWHRRAAFLTIVAGIVHLASVLFLH